MSFISLGIFFFWQFTLSAGPQQQQQQWPTFDCGLCPSRFYYEFQLAEHFNLYHTLPCTVCGGKFYSEEELRQHLHTEHSNMQPAQVSRISQVYSVSWSGCFIALANVLTYFLCRLPKTCP